MIFFILFLKKLFKINSYTPTIIFFTFEQKAEDIKNSLSRTSFISLNSIFLLLKYFISFFTIIL